MITTATEMKNNFGQYLKQVTEENIEVIITKNNQRVARLVPYITDIEKYMSLNDNVAENDYKYDKRTVSYDEFMEIYENSSSRMEYINGKIYLLASPSLNHQVLVGDLHIKFNQFFKDRKCLPFVAPFDIHFHKIDIAVPDVMQPDIIVLCDIEDNLNEKNKYIGTPRLTLEILSGSTRSKDMVYKLNTFMMSGVSEYWIIDSKRKSVMIYVFKDHKIEDFTHFHSGEVATSTVFEGLKVDVEELFSNLY